MKKIMLLFGTSILLIILFAIFIPNNTFAVDKVVEKIDVTLLKPIIGDTISSDTTRCQVKINDEENIVVTSVEYNQLTDQNVYEPAEPNSKFERGKKYSGIVSFSLPNNYVRSDSIVTKVNGITINSQDNSQLNWNTSGGIGYFDVGVIYEFGLSKVQKEISKLEAIIPEPIVGQKLEKDFSKFIIKADDEELLELVDIKWYHNGEQVDDDAIVDKDGKYRACLYFRTPSKYGMAADVIAIANSDSVDTNNSEDFFYANYGDNNYDYSWISKEFVAKNVSEEVKGETKEETIKINNPKTGDTIIKSFIISIMSVIGIALVINNIKKHNK